MKESIIATKSFDFAIQIISLYKKLTEEKEFVLSRQLLRSATSIGANVQEALGGQSKRDFAFKMSIANKEARETRYWLQLLDRSKVVNLTYEPYLNEVEQLVNILTSIVRSTQKSLGKPTNL